MSDRLPILEDIGVLGTGSCLGSDTWDNERLLGRISGYDESSGPFGAWVERVTHIQTRQYCTDEESVKTLGDTASQRAVEMAGIDPATIDLVLLCSFTQSELYPGDQIHIANNLNPRAGVVALTGGCAGSLYGMGMAMGMVKSGYARNVMVIGAEQLTPVVNFDDPITSILFADGAGAAIIGRKEPGDGSGMVDRVVLGHEPSRNIHMQNANMGVQGRVLGADERSRTGFAVERQFLAMAGGPRVLRNAINAMAETTVQSLGFTMEDLKAGNEELRALLDEAFLVPHQANGRIVDGLQDKLGMAEDHVIRTIYHAGNMSSATNMYTLDFAMREGNLRRIAQDDGTGIIEPCGRTLRKGDLVVMSTIGAGYIFGSIAFRL